MRKRNRRPPLWERLLRSIEKDYDITKIHTAHRILTLMFKSSRNDSELLIPVLFGYLIVTMAISAYSIHLFLFLMGILLIVGSSIYNHFEKKRIEASRELKELVDSDPAFQKLVKTAF